MAVINPAVTIVLRLGAGGHGAPPLHSQDVTDNGENWSVGQRQLVCLGRVLVKKSKVFVLDKATASLDTATDGMIKQTLAKHFTDSTVIMIAHRITSVLDSDMVWVLEQGLIEEYDSLTKLLIFICKAFAEYSMRSSSSYENLAATSCVCIKDHLILIAQMEMLILEANGRL
ncbi:putative ABC-type xenobiotic transporter [Helianthus debilis subsp. tardiflorus]